MSSIVKAKPNNSSMALFSKISLFSAKICSIYKTLIKFHGNELDAF